VARLRFVVDYFCAIGDGVLALTSKAGGDAQDFKLHL
jgi:hypothetical protein